MDSPPSLPHPGTPGPSRIIGSHQGVPLWLIGAPGSQHAFTARSLPDGRRDQGATWVQALAASRDPHLVRVYGAQWNDDRWWIETDYVAPPSLYDMLSGGAGLTPGQVATLLVPLARSLSRLHEAGVSHGHVMAPHVGLVDGRPVLSGSWLGPIELEQPGQVRGFHVTADIHDLARLGLWCLDDPTQESEVSDILREITRPGGSTQLSGRDLAAALLDVVTPQPLVGSPVQEATSAKASRNKRRREAKKMQTKPLTAAASADQTSPAGPPPPTRRQQRELSAAAWRTRGSQPRSGKATSQDSRRAAARPAIIAGIAVLVVGAAGVVAWTSRGGPSSGTQAAAVPPVAKARPTTSAAADLGAATMAGAITELVRARVEALGQCDEGNLRELVEPGSPAEKRELQTLRQACADGRTLAGLQVEVGDVRVLEAAAGDPAVVRAVVTSALGPYEIHEPGGDVAARIPGEQMQDTTITVVGGPGDGWRLREVAPGSAASPG